MPSNPLRVVRWVCVLFLFAAPVVLAGEEVGAGFANCLAAAASFRGLDLPDRPTTQVRSRAALREQTEKELASELPAGELAAADRVLEWLGLFADDDWRLTTRYLDLVTSEVAGYYDSDSGEVVLIEGAIVGGDAKVAEREIAERMVWVHEATHLLQDRNFDLDRFAGRPFLDDGAFARRALIEGDASHVMFSDALGFALERMPVWMDRELDFKRLAAGGPGLGSAAMAAAPRYVADSFGRPYLDGAQFVRALRAAGGTKLVDHAFRTDPPRSSEQILHPEKWLKRRDEPVALPLPDAGGPFAGQPAGFEGSLGEVGLLAVLAGSDTAESAAAGWGGDHLGYWHGGRTELLVWITEWDTPKDAQEFRSAFGERRDWTVQATGTRVVLIRERGYPKKLLADLGIAALGTPAERGSGRAPDLAALGIPKKAPPRVTFVDLLESFLARPAILEFAAATSGQAPADLEQLRAAIGFFRSNPDFVTRLEEALENSQGRSFKEMLNSPEIAKLRQERVAQLTTFLPAVATQDGGFRIPDAGCRGTGVGNWRVLAVPKGQQVSLLLERADLEARLIVVALATPLAGPSAEFLEGLVTPLRQSASAVVSERQEPGPTVTRKYIEILDREGHVRSSLMVVSEGHVTLLTAIFPTQRRREVRPVVEKIFASLRCGGEAK